MGTLHDAFIFRIPIFRILFLFFLNFVLSNLADFSKKKKKKKKGLNLHLFKKIQQLPKKIKN